MKRIFKEVVTAVAAVALMAGFVGCKGTTEFIEPNDSKNESAVVNVSEITWGGVNISDVTKYAKPGAKLHLEVTNRVDGGSEYCKVLLLQSDWSDSGVTEAHYEGDAANAIGFELKDNEGNDVHRPYVEGEGEYYFVLNEAACNASSLSLFGNATVKSIKIEYVGGKKVLAGPEGPASKVIKLEKNEYAATPQTQVKIAAGFDTVSAGDKVVVKMKGVSTKEFAAELMIVDATEAAGWWKELATKEEVTVKKEFDLEFTFEITSSPVGTGENSIMLAINGIDGDESVELNCTEFAISKIVK